MKNKRQKGFFTEQGFAVGIVVPKGEVDTALELLRAHGEDAYVIGQIVEGEEKS